MSQTADTDPAWAVWLRDGRESDTVALTAPSEAQAREQAIEESDVNPESVHIDGPYPDAEPAYFEFTYISEHREVVTVEAPFEDYAKDSADQKRDHRGQYKRTIRTESRRIPKDGGDDE